MKPRVSVVVPTCRRPLLLQRCLIALTHQRLPHHEFEILVVDDEWSEETRQLVGRIAVDMSAPTIRFLRSASTQCGPAAARNVGWRQANADIIAFTDDDTIPSLDWLKEGLIAMTPQFVAISGTVHVPLPQDPTDWDLSIADFNNSEFATANCFVRRHALELVGGFDERFSRPYREDSDLQFSLMRRGQRIGKAPQVVVLHPVRPAPWGISLHEQRNAFFDALLYKKHPQLYRLRIAKRPPWHYYLAASVALVAVIGLFGGNSLQAVLGFMAWLAWSAWFAQKRLQGTSRKPRHVAEMLFTSAMIPLLAVFWRIAGALRFKVLFA